MPLTYDEARSFISDGDIITVMETKGLLTPFTKFFTWSKATHTGQAIWLDGGLWMSELNVGKNHLIPMSQLADVDFNVSHCPIADRQLVRVEILEFLRIKVSYSILAAFIIGFLNFFRISWFLHARRMLVCSGGVIYVLNKCGWPECSYFKSPGEFEKMLEPKLQVRRIV